MGSGHRLPAGLATPGDAARQRGFSLLAHSWPAAIIAGTMTRRGPLPEHAGDIQDGHTMTLTVTVKLHVLRWARERASLAPAELARRVGLKEERVYQWEQTGQIS